tara:strand:+ start:4704 stop:5591 length:888 start_codon:yes stop_codon:yes gene_type:complete
MDGFILLDKPTGITSAKCVSIIKGILKEKKVGHCGTLDPLATGMLPICLGEATKFSDYVTSKLKKYSVRALLGVETDSGDITGSKIAIKEVNFTNTELKKVLRTMKGNLDQMPPMYSAIKQNGKPMYYWARRGIYLKRKAKKIYIKEIKLKSIKKGIHLDLEITCSKGTYIRTLVESIGRKLNTLATVEQLRRTHIGSYNESDMTKLSTEKSLFLENIIECDLLLEGFPKHILSPEETKKIINGQQLDYNAGKIKEGIVRLYEKEGSFIGIGNVDSAMKLSPKRLLNTSECSSPS